MLTSVLCRKCQQWAHEHQNWTTEQWKKLAWSDESCFLLLLLKLLKKLMLCMGLHSHRPVRVPMLTPVHCRKWCMCVSFTWGTHGTRMHYGKKASRQRQCHALGSVLLGNLGSCHPCG
ncbi:hypothetical protein QTP86_024356, partial [Hemibagrus guttatus]